MTRSDPGRRENRELPATLASGPERDASSSGDLVGRVLGGRYHILRKLGEGAMGAVYLGEHLKIGRQDAIKVLRDQLATDPDTIARFVRGTRNVSMIRHPNICTIYDYSDTEDGAQFVAMEFVPGETLRELLQREVRLPVATAVDIARQAADALDAAHEVGIVHRDLKPANIMVTPGRGGALEVKVVDFDIAKGSQEGEGEEVTRMGFVVGTPEYMSPEQLIGDRLDGRSDIYSLALVLYRMLTGTLPFRAQDTQDLMVKRLTEEPMTLSLGLPGAAFPPALELAIRRGLQRKPANRQASAAEFGREISAAGAAASAEPPMEGSVRVSDPVQPAEGVGSAARASGSRRRARALLGGGIVAALALTALAIVALGGDGEDPAGPLSPDPQPSSIVRYSDPLVGEPADESSAAPPGEVGSGEADEQGGVAGRGAELASRVTPVEEVAPAATSTQEGSIAAAAGTSAPPSTGIARPGQGELLSMLERVTAASPERSALLAIRDTAMAAWENRAAATLDRALAAYVAGNSLVALGDTSRAIGWLERAVDLRPDYAPYRSLLDLYRASGSGAPDAY